MAQQEKGCLGVFELSKLVQQHLSLVHAPGGVRFAKLFTPYGRAQQFEALIETHCTARKELLGIERSRCACCWDDLALVPVGAKAERAKL